jgi:gluconolactonase
MKRFFSFPLILATAATAYACSTSNSTGNAPGAAPDEGATDGLEDGGAPVVGDPGKADTGPPPGTEDPTGNPILLGPPRTVRTFQPVGGEPLFVDGPQWSVTKDALYVALPYATNLQGGKGILTTFKSDGTNYSELRAGDALTTGVIGNSVDGQGNLISAELKSITRTTLATGVVSVIASGYIKAGADAGALTPFDGPNDLIGLKDGTIYFTDPGYSVNPRPAVGHLFKIAANGTATIADSYDYNPSPNGIALSKDEKSLFVSFTAPPEGTAPFVRKYTINADRSLADMGKLVELPLASAPDGMAVDDDDNLYIALATGIAVFKATGEPYGGVGAALPQTVLAGGAALTFGGADRKSLFVSTSGMVVELRTKVPGLLQ